MELSPQSVATTRFKSVKKGYDPNEVRSYLANLSRSIESLQSHATAMEVRARAAVTRLQEIASQSPAEPATAPAGSVDEAETISRTLLLAQRTADTTVAEANAEAQRITENADSECRTMIEEAQEASDRMIEEAKLEARRSGEQQRIQIDSEVQALLARREFLISDVDHLELHVMTQRDRLRDVARSLTDIISDVPGGLGEVRRPLMSAVAANVTSDDRFDEEPDDTADDSSDEGDLGLDDPVVAPLTVSEPVNLTPIDAPDPDPDPDPDQKLPTSNEDAASTEEVDDAGAGVPGEPAERESTPPSGQPNRFLFEDVTGEIARNTPPRADGQMTIGGDELP